MNLIIPPKQVIVPITNDGVTIYVVFSGIYFVAIYFAIKLILQFNSSNLLICILLLSWWPYTCVARLINDDLDHNSVIIETMSTRLPEILSYYNFISTLLRVANPSQDVFILYSPCGMSMDSIKLAILRWFPNFTL